MCCLQLLCYWQILFCRQEICSAPQGPEGQAVHPAQHSKGQHTLYIKGLKALVCGSWTLWCETVFQWGSQQHLPQTQVLPPSNGRNSGSSLFHFALENITLLERNGFFYSANSVPKPHYLMQCVKIKGISSSPINQRTEISVLGLSLGMVKWDISSYGLCTVTNLWNTLNSH